MGLSEEEINALISYRINKSKSILTEALDVANLGHWNLSVNRLYYAVFHMCSALLLSRGHTARTHNGVIQMIMKEFVKTEILSKPEGSLISSLFNMRNTGDYDDLFDWNKEQVLPLIAPTEELLSKIEKLI